jgi:hypothetical protein
MDKLSYFLLLAIVSVTSCDKPRIATSRELIKRHQTDTIPSTLGVRTTFIIVRNNTFGFQKGDTVGKITYNSEGRVLEDDSNPFRTYKWVYDSTGIVSGFIHRDWDLYDDYKVTYSELPDSALLVQQFTERHQRTYRYSERYHFDQKNRVRKREIVNRDDLWNWLIQGDIRENAGQFRQDTTEGKTILKYFYDSSNKVLNVECWTNSRESKGRKSNQIFYYSDNRLDSSIRTFDQYKYSVRSYNSNGIEVKRVYNDTLELNFIHL